MTLRVLFLDCDGCVAPFRVERRTRAEALDPILVKRLGRFVEKHNLVVVLSSTWRFEVGLGATRRMLAQHWPGALDRIRHATPILDNATRGQEILAWLLRHPVSGFIIIDDDTAMAPLGAFQVVTDPWAGLRAKDLVTAAAILRRQCFWVYEDNVMKVQSASNS